MTERERELLKNAGFNPEDFLPPNEKVKALKKKLADTDYVITKIAEAELYGEDTTALKMKYAETIAKRKRYRAEISELENRT